MQISANRSGCPPLSYPRLTELRQDLFQDARVAKEYSSGARDVSDGGDLLDRYGREHLIVKSVKIALVQSRALKS